MSSQLGPAWQGIVTDTAVVAAGRPGAGPGGTAVADSVAAYAARTGISHDLVGSLALGDDQLPGLRKVGTSIPYTLRVSGGAGMIPGACQLAGKIPGLAALEVALRDLDDLPGNARRVTMAIDQAHAEGVLDEDLPVYIAVPQVDLQEPSHGWLAAADEVAAVEHRLRFSTGDNGTFGVPSPTALAAMVDAALDRELPFRCTELSRAVRPADGSDQHGFLNVLLATQAAFDGAPHRDAVDLLDSRDVAALTSLAGSGELSRARRWFTSFGSDDVAAISDELAALDLVELS